MEEETGTTDYLCVPCLYGTSSQRNHRSVGERIASMCSQQHTHLNLYQWLRSGANHSSASDHCTNTKGKTATKIMEKTTIIWD